MKMAFVVHNEHFTPEVMRLLKDAGIDYYTRWDHAQGKGHGTEPHLGTGGYASMNAVLMIGFPDEARWQGSSRRSPRPTRRSRGATGSGCSSCRWSA
jgi:hypothetical protein